MAGVSALIHGELQSANVLLTPEGRAKIADAGLAVAMMNETHRSDVPMVYVPVSCCALVMPLQQADWR